jgi:hypothetical protein
MMNENKGDNAVADLPRLVADLMSMLHEATSALAFTVERQAATLAQMTQREPSMLPFVAPIAVKILDYAFGPKSGAASKAMGPRERKVVAEYEVDHARLLRELEEKRAMARAVDAAARGPVPWAVRPDDAEGPGPHATP